MSAKLISIIGPVAVGKTTLAKYLGEELPAEVLYEDFEGNPFLAESFSGFEELSLPSQLYFLLSRVKQLSIANWPAGGVVVCDYGFCQDRIFAEARLEDDDRLFYEHISRQIEYLVHPPSVLVHLDATVGTLMKRIEGRGRQFEAAFSIELLERLRQAYFGLAVPARCRLLRIDCEQVDLLDRTRRAELARQIREAL